jgi:CheY-like chemotaxis protein
MPRRREMTLDCLKFEWDPSGAAASARAETMTRPMAYEIGRVLLTLLEPGAGEGGRNAPSVATIASRASLSEHDARAAVHDLQPTGVVIRQRERRGRTSADARWARGYELAPRGDVRGPGRRPRLVKLALLLDPDLPCGDLMDVLLRRVGVLAVQVTSPSEAVRLLEHIGFDLILVDSMAGAESPGPSALARATRAAACDHAVLLRRPDAPADLDHQAVGCHVTLSKPFSVREFDSVLGWVGLGSMVALPRTS